MLYLSTGSYTWAYAASGFVLLPLVPFLWWGMPETAPPNRRQPFTWAALGDAIATQADSVHLFLGHRRMCGLLLVSFLVKFLNTSILGVVLYWGQSYIRGGDIFEDYSSHSL